MRSVVFVKLFAWLLLFSVCAARNAAAQAPADGEVREKFVPIQVTEVAPGLFFQYHHQESNNAWLVTDEGVLVIDSRQHPRRGEELLAAIRKTTDKSRGIRLGNFVQIRTINDEELEQVWAGKKTAQEALDAAVKRGNEQLERFQKANQGKM